MPISKRLSQLLENMAPHERAEVETFCGFCDSTAEIAKSLSSDR
jgi:hypothetical protein